MTAKKPSNDLTPGTKTPTSGQYPVIGPRGGKTGREITSVEGKPQPPGQRKGETYGKPDATKHKPK